MTHLPINITDLLRQRTVEGERVEYKAGWNPEVVLHTICAFANDFHNLGGGYVVIGVAEEGGRPVLPPQGIDPGAVDAILKELLGLGNNAMQPYYHPLTATYEIDGRTVLVLWAHGGETRPYKAKVGLGKKSSEWAYYIRRHSNTVRARGQDERELIGLAATVPFDDRYQQGAELEAIDRRLIRDFLHEVGSELEGEADALDLVTLGRQMNIIGGPSERPFPKNVGLLFFCEHPERFFPATQVDVVYFPDGPGGDTFEEKVFRGPLGQIARAAVKHIDRNYLKETVIKHPDRPEAQRFSNFPLAAIEEAVVNAIYHRSYEIREPIEVRITREELVVLSFPGPDHSIRLEDLRAGKAVSRRYRNRRIGEFLKELDLTEGRSTGIPKILRAMAANGSPAPVFETDEDRSYFLIRLPVHEQALVAQETTPEVTGEVTGEVERLVLAVNGTMTRRELQAALDLKHEDHFRAAYLTPALEDGIIEMTIPDKPRSRNQRYRLTARGKALRQAKEAP